MKKSYAALQLLAHGPLIFRDFSAITGWGKSVSASVLKELWRSKKVTYINIGGKRHYTIYE